MVEIPDYPSLVTQDGLGYASMGSPASDAVPAAPPPLMNPDTHNPPAPLEAVAFATDQIAAPENEPHSWTAAPGGKWDTP